MALPAPRGGAGAIRLENDLVDDTKTEDKTSLRYLSEQRARELMTQQKSPM